ncbi:MAG: ATP-dependent Clp protease ATP-binding subunit [bacterium]
MGKPFTRLTTNSKLALKYSAEVTDLLSSKFIQPLYLFIGLLLVREGIASRIVTASGIDIDELISKYIPGFKRSFFEKKRALKNLVLSRDVKIVVSRAFSIAKSRHHVYVGTEHILLAILENSDWDFVRDIERSGVRLSSIQKMIFEYTSYPSGILSKKPSVGQDRNPSVLDIFGQDLTDMARLGQLDPLVGREEELDEVINILSRRRKNNPVIVGEAGVGKTALVEGLAQKIVSGKVPESLRNTRIITLDISGVLAGSKMRGDLEEKMIAIINEVSNSPDIILFIDEIHNILGYGQIAGGGMDIAGILKPALVNGKFRCIGATTLVDYNRYFEDDVALSRRFQKIDIEEASVEDSIKILKKTRPLLENHHGVIITDEAIEYAVKLSDQYVSDRYLPDKAIDLMDEASAARRLEIEGKYKDLSDAKKKYQEVTQQKERAVKEGNLDKASILRQSEEELEELISGIEKERGKKLSDIRFHVNSDIVRKVVSRWTGIPLTTLGSSEASKLVRLDGIISKKVIGQSEAVGKVADAIKRARTGITSGERPWASFLFLGPTGVGKTELAKVLTETLFGDEDRLIQVDMSEYMEMHSVSKMIGSPPGYVGYTEGGQLTEKVRRNPHCVILFDEIEKAHMDVLNILLQILEYGHLTDAKGRRVNFKNTVIILTSNIGAGEIKKDKVLGFEGEKKKVASDKEMNQAYSSMKEVLLRELKDTLSPELLNRLDDIVIFRALTPKDAKGIVDILVEELNTRLSDQNIVVKIDAKARNYIAGRGFNEEYGARPLRRVIQDELETAVAKQLLKTGIDEIRGKGKMKTIYVSVTTKKDKLVLSDKKK